MTDFARTQSFESIASDFLQGYNPLSGHRDGEGHLPFYDPIRYWDVWNAPDWSEVTVVDWEKRAGGMTKLHLVIPRQMRRVKPLSARPITFCQREVLPPGVVRMRQHEAPAPDMKGACAVCVEQWSQAKRIATRKISFTGTLISRPHSFINISP